MKAGVVGDPNKYPWSSFHFYINSSKHTLGLVACEGIHDLYSQNKRQAVFQMAEYTNRQSNERFMDMKNETDIYSRIKSIMEGFLNQRNTRIHQLDKDSRNELIMLIKEKTDESTRNIAEVLGIGRNTVQRVLKDGR